MSDIQEPTSTNIPEWRRTVTPSRNSLPTKQFVRRPKDTAGWKNHRFVRNSPSETQGSTSWVKSTGPTPKISLESLGTDLWFLISANVSKATLLSVCQSSPALHAQVLPVLYHTVDLSSHSPPDGGTISFRDRRKAYEGQYLFMRQISMKPEYGKYVRALKWTLGVEREQVWSVALDTSGFRTPTSLNGERVVWNSANVGKLFSCLPQVVNLDMEYINRAEAKSMATYKNLFPAIQKVNLAGTSNIPCFLLGAGVTSLSVLNFGPYAVGRPDFTGLTQTGQSSTNTILPNSTKYPDILHPDFQLRCKGLHTLSITLQHLDLRSGIQDFYTALATFILNIRPRSLIFHLVGMNGKPLLQPISKNIVDEGVRCHRCQGRLVVAPGGQIIHWHRFSTAMTNELPDHFRNTLLPILMNGWEGLQKVEIKGVMKNLLVDMRVELAGRGIALVGDGWEEEPVFTNTSVV